MRLRNARIDLTERQLRARHEPGEAHERGDPVDRRIELRNDITTSAVAGEDRVLEAGCLVSSRETSEPTWSRDGTGDVFGNARRRDRYRDAARVQLRCDEVHQDQQRAVVVHDDASLVDKRDPLTDRIESDAERGSRGGDQFTETSSARMCSATVSVGDDSSSRLLTVSTSMPMRPSSVGNTKAAVPPAVSMTTFRPRRARPSCRRNA